MGSTMQGEGSSSGRTEESNLPRVLPTGQIPIVKRPKRHYAGRDFTLYPSLDEALRDFNPTTEYLQEFYPKAHEYRVIICKGVPIITLVKQVDPDTPNTVPWNHSNGNSRFVTVNNRGNDRLRHTNVYPLIEQNKENFFKHIDLCGLDVMLNLDIYDKPYAVCELNFCPSISIPDNIQKVSDYVKQL
jgi:hypothetical protein